MNSRSLDLAVDLTCELDGQPVQIFSTGRKIVVEIDSVSTARKVAEALPPGISLRKRLKGLKSFLDTTGFQLEGRVKGKVMGCIGDGVGSRLWCLFGLPVMRLHPYDIIVAMRPSGSERN